MHSRPKLSAELVRSAAWPLVCCLVVASCLTALLDAFDQQARAGETAADERTEDESPALDDPIPGDVAGRQPGERPLPQRDPFATYRSDPGAWSFDQLSPERRAELEANQQWAEADSGDPVHLAFQRASSFGVARARARTAERDVGLVGVARLGVN